MDGGHRRLLWLLSFAALLTCGWCQCLAGWRENVGNCYLFSNDEKSWLEANAYCLAQNSNLMSIQTIEERLWLRTQILSHTYWIGLNDQVTEGVWQWSDGSPFIEYLSQWMHGQPDNWGDGEDCAQVNGNSHGQWMDENCADKKKYICKHVNPNPGPQCDLTNGWRQYGSNCYKVKADMRKSWAAARHDCVQEGGDLVSITSVEEEQYITGQMDQSWLDLWIGLSTLKCNKISCQVEVGSSQFTWTDTAQLQYTNWAEGEPTVDAQSGSCAAIIKDSSDDFGKWRSHQCRYERPYMCKRPLNTICPAGWMSFAGSCYWMVSNIHLLTTWYDAYTRCSDIGAHLLIINSQEEQFFINGKLPDFHQTDIPDIWIGLSDKDQDGVFKWVDKSPVQFSNYGPGWPRNTAGLWDCGQIFTGNYEGKWETTNCFKSLGFVCEMTGGQNPKPTPIPEYHCDHGYLLYGNFCYHFETEAMKNWHDAEDHCKGEQGHLTSLHSQEELSFLTAHMPTEAWVGLNDIDVENKFVNTDGTPANFLPWGNNQPDNWQNNEDCVQLRGMNHHEAGKINDDFCTSTKDYICKKAKGQGPPPQPPTFGPGWNEKCGSWMADPFNDYCYLFNYLSMRTWAEARADCVNQGGELASITDPYEQAFIQGVIQSSPTGITLWTGGHDSITEGGWEWTDGSPFRYIRWGAGNPDDYFGEDCLSIYINDGYWNDDDCEYKRGYICKKKGNTPEPPPPHDGFMTALVCQGSSAVLHCAHESVINIQSAFYGRRSDTICPHLEGSGGSCTVDGVLPYYRKMCDNRPFCFAYANVEEDPCPAVSKYLEIVYSCEQTVCLHGLGVEDGLVTDSQLSASSSLGVFTPDQARLKGNSCWMPSGNPTSSWIQVNLGPIRKVTGIAIQGCPQNDYWITKFKIQHSMDGTTWTDYTADGEFFPGSVDRDTPDTQLLGTPVSAKYVRILPLEFSGQAGLRFDILGCTPDYAITCDDKPNFTFSTDKMTVHCPAGCAKTNYIVYGTTLYRGDSNICAAAIHAGVVLNDIGGDCTLLKVEGQDFYAGSTRNGITTRQFDGNYAVSYTFADGELRCSGPDWFEFGEFCYKPFGDKKTWHDARETCRSLGADLVSVLSMTEQSWLESYLFMATSDVWTGLNDLFVPGMFFWSDQHMVSFTYWAPGEPNNHDGFSEDCVEMLHQTGRWNDVSCAELNTYICKMPKDHYPVPSVEPTVYGCPQGWDAYGYSCYWMEETARSWYDAKAFCKEQEGFLLHIGDIYEQAHFTVTLSGKTGLWWLGLRAQGVAGGGVDYIWDNNSPLTFTHWDRDQPDNGDGTCVAMTTGQVGGFWDDKQCSEKYAFVCEKFRPDISPPTGPPTPPPAQGCAEGWTALPHYRNCYRLFHNVDWSLKKSWGAAHEDCVARGADLVSVHSKAEEEFLSLYSKASSKWIGLKHNPTEGGYSWSDGTPLSHTNWGHGEPNDHEGREECVEMVSSDNGTYSWWNDLNCDAHQDWICMIAKGKNPILPPVPPPPVPAPDCGSNPGWRKNNNICYYYNDTDVVDFHTAMIRCYTEKASLVSILSKDEQAYVNSMVGTGDIAASWIGMRVFGIASAEYKWLDHSPVTYTHWASGEPNNANGEEQCVQINRHQGGWNDANCGRAAGYLCKKFPGNDHTAPPPTQPWVGNCPTGWIRFRNKCFTFKGKKNDLKANWSYARSWCKEQGAELAVIDDQLENDFVSSYLRDLELPTWIGLSDLLEENQYAWSDGVSPVKFTNWNDKEPNNAGGTEHCVAMSHGPLVTGKWNDDACHKDHSFMCSMQKSTSLPPPPTASPCPAEYVPWYQNCYKLVEKPETWEAAQASCQQEGGNLASIDMSYDQAFIALVALQAKADTWIGLRRKDDGSYSWTDGWPVFFTHWGPGEPTNIKDEGCVSMHSTSHHFYGTWNDTKCDQAKPYICKITSEHPPPTPGPGDGKCLPFWIPYGHYCYLVYNEQQGFSWPDSRHYCQSARGDLASIHSRAEVEFLRNLNHTKHHNIWIGLTRDHNFGWGWTDLTSLGFLNWAQGEPNAAFHPGEVAEENCVEMYADGLWNDNNCLQKRGFVCRHRQYHSTDDGGNPIFPTDGPHVDMGAAIAGAVITAVVIFSLILGTLYYVFRVRGFKLSGLTLPTRAATTVDVPAFNNPNFGGESDT
ncbi:macrophage mannose receptor 1-like [Solea senegalensis]|uniref:Macrophage mannose receptor 1-like n=1 Tax=Solea senegalensis TaxID=28829 RepID=A0AAV6R1H7_SOLSE|nr:macrophage mannose receptor 1 [Solea senegalensis]KAG7499177.1 macrophage mannose receptor 1-like [Solea senegalensis]